ncbi:DUF1501 domain-containing protein [Thalassoroseus pseudoceratinae]|uniref:DUF1501 domain-containing protein n=1 Tax=Thalassoroseus pseudoceratinae TaxID=2713176 RepID=UPI00141F5E56|nr:DUF1501 domain-containing protein [Thalassoroseus pseudoceratinae]
MNLTIPRGMNRRHFMQHLATAATTIPTMQFLSHLQANAAEVKKKQKACILMWMGGGPPTIDIWDLKPGSKNGGEFKPIQTAAPGVQISEHMPNTAKVMDNLSIVRSMSTREADHGRGRYYMHTAYVPNPTVTHPTFGSVVSHELSKQRPELEIPAFVSIGGASNGPGFLGMAHAPFVVDSNGNIRNADMGGLSKQRLNSRLQMLDVVETNFINSDRGDTPKAHREVYQKAVNLMTSDQMKAFKTADETPETVEAYGNNNFGRGLLMARRLVETGVPFIEVSLGGWDLHNDVFNTLRDQRLPVLDQGIAALTNDLKQRGMLDDVVLVWMGEFGRTPRINQNVGRDHWAASWSVMIGGGGLNNGQAVGETDADGVRVVGKSYQPGDVWATVAHALGIPLDTVFTSKRGRPMRIANGAAPIPELIG